MFEIPFGILSVPRQRLLHLEVRGFVVGDKILVLGHGQHFVQRRALDGAGVAAPEAGARQFYGHHRRLIRQDLNRWF